MMPESTFTPHLGIGIKMLLLGLPLFIAAIVLLVLMLRKPSAAKIAITLASLAILGALGLLALRVSYHRAHERAVAAHEHARSQAMREQDRLLEEHRQQTLQAHRDVRERIERTHAEAKHRYEETQREAMRRYQEQQAQAYRNAQAMQPDCGQPVPDCGESVTQPYVTETLTPTAEEVSVAESEASSSHVAGSSTAVTRQGVSFLAIPVLLALLAGTVALVVVVIRKFGFAHVALTCLGLLMLVGLGSAAWWLYRDDVESPLHAVAATPPMSENAAPGHLSAAAWDSNLELTFEPDVYTSERLAVAGLVRRLLNQATEEGIPAPHDSAVPDTLAQVDHTTSIIVYTDRIGGHPLLEEILRKDPRIGSVHYATLSQWGRRSNDHAVHVKVEPPVDLASQAYAEIRVQLEYGDRLFEQAARYMAHPDWLVRLGNTDGVHMKRGQQGLDIVAGSTQLHDSSEGATEQAIRLVVDLIENEVIRRAGVNRWNHEDAPHGLSAFIQRIIRVGNLDDRRSHVRTTPLLVENFSQNFERDYGRVYRSAVQVIVPHDVMDHFEDVVKTHRVEVHQTWLVRAGALAAMIVLIVLTYAFLNAATKGYFRAWLIGGSLVVLLGGMVIWMSA